MVPNQTSPSDAPRAAPLGHTAQAPSIYLDYQATTPLDPRVFTVMQPYFTRVFGNPASRGHDYGREAAEAVNGAREAVARMIGGSPLGLVFTSGATEANNLALKGLFEQHRDRARHFVSCRTEHPAVLDVLAHLVERGAEVTWLEPDRSGHIDPDELRRAIRPDTLAVSLMYANNETGVVHDVAAIGAITRDAGVFFHCDATQAAGKLPLDVGETGIDLLTFSGHKIYGPKGIGALYAGRSRPRVRLVSQMHGGGHERGFRSGTLNVPAIVGLAAALDLAENEREREAALLKKQREALLHRLRAADVAFQINGDPVAGLPGCLNLRFVGVDGAALQQAVPRLAFSRGSACSSAVPTPSKVLLAMGLGAIEAGESLRLSLGRFTSDAEVETAAELLIEAVCRLRDAPDHAATCEL
ncbi:Cysteine desulfurase [Sulfidibacter corallicola]|uniref:cysteine desulfurase n=1 Tax=Sulfidibacter corallicola TaxID=2818388 RepID=A0A8A4TTM9_SULCO|nr:cysteine desulfurase family protein [Sulfidibacter corallicola]QTD52458.1 cysteine desulfurase [Sulfidibacter corallicola]